MELIDHEQLCPDMLTCRWQHNEPRVLCRISTVSTCPPVTILEARESDFHDLHLQKATRAIKAVIDMIPEDPKGRKLSFLQTKMGALLAWVEHGSEEAVEDGVTADDDDDTVRRALGIIV